MTTNNLEVVAYATHHDEPMLLPNRAEAAAYCDDGEEPLALIHISDYEALQAECEKLRKDAKLWESNHDDIHRRADKEHALAVPDGFREIVEAVAHIGVDFGYGNFALSQEHIEKARELLAAAPSHSQKSAETAEIKAQAIEEAVNLYAHKWSEEFAEVSCEIMRKGMGFIYPEGLLEYAKALRCPSHESEQGKSIDDLPGMWCESDLSGGWADSCNQQTEGDSEQQ